MAEVKNYHIKIEGMTCAACSAASERALSKTKGVISASVNLALGSAEVTAEAATSPEMLLNAVSAVGYKASFATDEDLSIEETHQFSKAEIIIGLIFGFLVMYIGMSHMLPFPLPLPGIISMEAHPLNFALSQLLLCLPVLVVGRRFFLVGFRQLFKLHPNMDSLVAVGTSAALLYSLYNTFQTAAGNVHAAHNLYYESAAVVLALVLLGKYLEEHSKNSAKAAISSLATLIPQKATILKDGKKIEVDTSEIQNGDTVLVTPGEKISVDGEVLEGEADVDEAMLTGESVPVFKSAGETVSGGTICKDGMLKIRATGVGSATAVAQIIKLVSEAQARKAPVARLADTISGIFVPSVIAIAVVSVIIWAILGKDASFLLNIFVSVLVVACPCALGLATPIAVMVASGRGAKLGVLYRGGDVIERLSKIDMALFDKTGTITEGNLRVAYIETTGGATEEELMRLAAGVEFGSGHPIAVGIVEYAKEKVLPVPEPEKVVTFAGRGVSGVVEGAEILAGTRRMLDEKGISTAGASRIPDGLAVVYVVKDGVLLGVIGLADTVRKKSRKAIERLKKEHVQSGMITGDNKAAADYVAKEVGLDRVLAEVLPGDKSGEVTRLKEEGHSVAMVGDGINDAPALAAADVGACVFGGTDVAAQSAGVLLMREDLLVFCDAVSLSRYTMRIVRQNLFWAFCYNVIGIPIAAGLLYPFGILLSPAFAGLAMALSSVCVVGNSLRITKYSPAK